MRKAVKWELQREANLSGRLSVGCGRGRLSGQCAQAMADKKRIMHRGDDREGKDGAEKRKPGNPNPAGRMDLQEKDEKNRGNLGERVGFSEDTGAEIAEARDGKQQGAHGEDANVATEYQYSKFPWDSMQDGEHQEHGAEQKFVGNGIEILAQQGLLFQGTREKAVEAIAKPSKDEQRKRPKIVPGDQMDDDEGHKNHAQQRELVGRGEYFGGSHQHGPPATSASGPLRRCKIAAASSPVLLAKR